MKTMIKIGEKEFVNGDIYYNPFFGDLWIIQKDTKIRKLMIVILLILMMLLNLYMLVIQIQNNKE